MLPSGKLGACLKLAMAVQKKLEAFFSKAFGHVQLCLETEVEDTNVLVFGRHGEYLRRERATTLQHVGVSAELWMPTVEMSPPLQHGRSWKKNLAIIAMHA